MTGSIPPNPFELALRLRRSLAGALVAILAFVPFATLSIGKAPPARVGLPAAPANETEPDAEETEAKLSLRAQARWSPPRAPARAFDRPFPRPNASRPAPFERPVPALVSTDGLRLRC